jgi:multisubunit Na+/H+ antiporter MnhB subunit
MFLKLKLQEQTTDSPELSGLTRCLCAAIIAVVIGALIFVLVQSSQGQISKAAPDLAALVSAKIPVSGVGNPVTAVLLNFRSFDTLLEIAVLLIVAIAMMPAPIATHKTRLLIINHHHFVHPVLEGLVRWLVPLAILVSGYLLWTGAHAPGGAFQAGAVLAGAGVALSLTRRHAFVWGSMGTRLLLTVGLLAFITVAVSNFISTGTVLQYPLDYTGGLILLVEIAATLSIAAILLLLFTRLMTVEDVVGGGGEK